MSFLLRLLRLLALLFHLLLGVVLTFIIYSSWLRPLLPKNLAPWIVCTWSRLLCWICGLKLRFHGEYEPKTALWVANHISWLDIFAILGRHYMIFVSKQEVSTWLLIGWLVSRVGTLYVKRGANSLHELTANMTYKLQQQQDVLLFPEGTTTDGSELKPFFARLLQPANNAQVLIQPIALRYTENGELSNNAPYIGDDTFLSHLWKILAVWRVELDIYYCEPIQANGQPRRELANLAQTAIREKLGLIKS
jgi:1-acyl-sn-glycerol-3-phosphate acyltransferase